MTTDDPGSVRAQTKKDERDDKTRKADLRSILETQGGRRVMWSLMSRCGIFRTSFDRESATQTAFNEGERNIGLMLQDDILSASPEAYLKMTQESKIKE